MGRTWTAWIVVAGLLGPAGAGAHGGERPADLSRLVVVGDSLSAGFQNGSLLGTQQPNGYAAVIAQQAEVPLPLPLIALPGIPNVLELVTAGPPPVLTRADGVSSGRVDPTVVAFDLAVPGATVQDALTRRPDVPIDSMTDLILGLPGLFAGVSRSQIEWAEALAPTTIIAWLGNNDTLGAAVAGDATRLTPVADFERAYGEALDRLHATGASLVVGNIPDVTVIPFLTPAEDVAALLGLPFEVVGPILGIETGDYVTADAFDAIAAILGGVAAPPLAPNLVLDANEVVAIRERTVAFNEIIARKAEATGAALVDVQELLARIDARGIEVNGRRLTTQFLGGMFSLDGVHPTNTGYAVLANAFIQAMNTRLAANVPLIPLHAVAEDDPLVPARVQPGHALGHIDAATARSLRAVIGR